MCEKSYTEELIIRWDKYNMLIKNAINTKEAAKIIEKTSGEKITTRQIAKLCEKYTRGEVGGLTCVKKGRDWLIDRRAAENYRRMKPGPKPVKKSRRKS